MKEWNPYRWWITDRNKCGKIGTCEECERGKTWCDTCGVHHDFSGFTHADWFVICSCGCRCQNGL